MKKVSIYYNLQTLREYQIFLKKLKEAYKMYRLAWKRKKDIAFANENLCHWSIRVRDTHKKLEKQFWKNIGQNARARARIDKGN